MDLYIPGSQSKTGGYSPSKVHSLYSSLFWIFCFFFFFFQNGLVRPHERWKDDTAPLDWSNFYHGPVSVFCFGKISGGLFSKRYPIVKINKNALSRIIRNSLFNLNSQYFLILLQTESHHRVFSFTFKFKDSFSWKRHKDKTIRLMRANFYSYGEFLFPAMTTRPLPLVASFTLATCFKMAKKKR